MVQTCNRCARRNPADAAYCYYDGNLLHGSANGGRIQPGLQQFPAPFAFPSGLACRNFDQLALACQQNWLVARDLLQKGVLETFFGSLGRMDLAQGARAAAHFPDRDRGLDQLLAQLPSKSLAAPKLRVVPPQLDLGTLTPGRGQRFDLRLVNDGMRLLYGSVTSDCKWLALGDGPGAPQKLFQCGADASVRVQVRGDQLRATNKPLAGRLTVESNGGTVTVEVRALVPVQPLTQGVLAGSLSPRQVAEKAKANPKEAAALFEKGVVAEWYKANGWSYPVVGPSASGVSAVQQFFEALGLTRPPRVELAEAAINLRGRGGENLEHRLQVRTQEKRPVYAHATSDQPWLVVGRAQLAGPTAVIPLQVRQIPNRPGEVLKARVVVTANGNQRFVVPVSLTVAALVGRGLASSPAPATLTGFDTAITHAAAGGVRGLFAGLSLADELEGGVVRIGPRRKQVGWKQLLPLLLLLLLLGSITFRDAATDAPLQNIVEEGDSSAKIQAAAPPDKSPAAVPKSAEAKSLKVDIQDEPEERGPEAPQPVKVAIRDEPEEGGAPMDTGPEIPVDPTPLIDYAYELKTLRVGITALKVRARDGTVAVKQITYRKDGSTNNTGLKVNGSDGELAPPDGSWRIRKQALPDDPKGLAVKRTQSIFKRGNIEVAQIVEVVASKQPVEVAPGVRKRQLDTVLVRYVIENKDAKSHRVGMRVMVDTLIGENDGVPFAVPGEGMVTTSANYTDETRASKQIPDFVQALEVPDLQNPGTVAHMTFKLGGRMEPPNRVSLTHWPYSKYQWDVPVKDMDGDSAVAIYWNERLLEPGQRRVLGYAYGLGGVTSTEGGGKLGITLGGSFEPGQVFTVTTYVTNPIPGQMLELTAPEGLQIQDKVRLPVPDGKGSPPTSIVTWKVKVLQTGEFRIRVTSSTGTSQSKTIAIARPSGGRFVLELSGSFEPGQVFTARADVTDPLPGQTLKLVLPAGLERAGGQEVEPVPVPMGAEKGAVSAVEWKVKVRTPGKHLLRVQSSTGLIQTKTITIDPEAGRFVIDIEPTRDLAPGKDFSVIARVTNPLPGQRLTLQLPDKLSLQEGEQTQAVPALPMGMREGTTTVTWRVRILDHGRLPVRVQSSTGVTRAKTIILSGPGTIFGK